MCLQGIWSNPQWIFDQDSGEYTNNAASWTGVNLPGKLSDLVVLCVVAPIHKDRLTVDQRRHVAERIRPHVPPGPYGAVDMTGKVWCHGQAFISSNRSLLPREAQGYRIVLEIHVRRAVPLLNMWAAGQTEGYDVEDLWARTLVTMYVQYGAAAHNDWYFVWSLIASTGEWTKEQ